MSGSVQAKRGIAHGRMAATPMGENSFRKSQETYYSSGRSPFGWHTWHESRGGKQFANI